MKYDMRKLGAVAVLVCVAGVSASLVAARGAAGPQKLLEDFADAWNRHDVDALMSMMTDDGVFEAAAGSALDGEKYVGKQAVRGAYQAVFDTYPDAHWGSPRHVVTGDRGMSEWTFTGTMKNGSRVEVTGCDLFTFRDGKIAIKNSYRKNRPPAQPATAAAPKPAYLIASSRPIHPERMDPYRQAAGPLARAAGLEILASGNPALHVLEGKWTLEGGLTIERYRSMDDLLAFWNSPGYREAKKLRDGLVDMNFIVALEGR
jgi:ketosteroid isomerase-like protein/uncharacterized protein (DUF1330 family)